MRGSERKWRRRTLAAALVLALGCVGQARADAVSAEQVQALEQQLRAWLATLLGPRIPLGERPVRLTPEGDRYGMEIPFAGKAGDSGIMLDGPPLTAAAQPLSGGRWALDAIHLPSPLHIVLPGNAGAWTVTLNDQQSHALLDPSLASASTWDSRIGDYTARWRGPGGERRTEAAAVTAHLTWRAGTSGRMDVTGMSSSELLATNTRFAGGGIVSFSAAHSRIAVRLDGLAPERLPAFLHAALGMAPLVMTAAGPHDEMTPELRAALLAALDAAPGLLDGFDETVTMEDVHVHAPGLNAAMRKLTLGAGAAAPDGRLRLRLRFAVDGLDSPAAPAGPLHDYMPHHIALTPRLSGVPAGPLLSLLRTAIASAGNDPALPAEAATLLREGPFAVGLDELAADFGPAMFTASGEIQVTGAGQVTGQAHIRATGLDALIKEARTAPSLRQVLPTLIFLKGMGEPKGDATVWDVSYADGRIAVNGTDMTQLLSGFTQQPK